MADDIECEICYNDFDEEDRRPNNLPCGHTFCRLCMEREIANGKRTCPTCRKKHRARSVHNLPINVALERVIQNRNRKRALDSDEDDDEDGEDGGRCPTHKKSVLYFYCETHLIMVCRDCTVLEHPVTNCKIIPIQEHIKRRRMGNMCKIRTNITDINDTINRLNNFIAEKDKTISSHKLRIEEMKKEIKDLNITITLENQVKSDAQIFINKGEAFKGQNDVEKQSLDDAHTMNDIDNCVHDIDLLTSNIRKWRQDVDRDYLDDCH